MIWTQQYQYYATVMERIVAGKLGEGQRPTYGGVEIFADTNLDPK